MRTFLVGLLMLICLLFIGNGYVYADEYIYDENGRVIEIVHDDGSVTTYTYDENGNILSISTVASDSKLNNEEITTEIELTTEDYTTTTEEQTTASEPTTESTTENNQNTDDNGSKYNGNNNQSNNNNVSAQSGSNKTGDESLIYISILCLIISACALGCLMIKKFID